MVQRETYPECYLTEFKGLEFRVRFRFVAIDADKVNPAKLFSMQLHLFREMFLLIMQVYNRFSKEIIRELFMLPDTLHFIQLI